MGHHNRYGLRRLLSLLLGIAFTALGVVASLAYFGINLGVPAFLMAPMIMKIALVVAALLLFLDSFSVSMEGKFKIGSTIIAIILAGIAAIPMLLDYKIMDTIPFLSNLSVPTIALSIMLALYGIYLIIVYSRLKRASLFFY